MFLFAIISCKSQAQDELLTRNVVTGLDTPWEILWGPDNYIWITERYGRISRLNPETGELIELISISEVLEDGERGLMGLALHPEFETNPWVYTIYTYGTTSDTKIKLVRYIYDGAKLHTPEIIIDNILGWWNHDGSRIWIDPDDMTLFMTMGDAAKPDLAQDHKSLNGKTLRMNLDGSIPDDNPYPNSYIWTTGNRNAQGLVVANGIMYSSEHGPSSDDELNIIYKGRNYGWPTVKGFCDTQQEKIYCADSNVVEPIAAWTPTLAVAGIDYYNSDLIPEWKNSILMTTLKAATLVQIKLTEDGLQMDYEKNFFSGKYGRLRDICISPDGRVFIATSNKDGRGSPAQVDDRIIEISSSSTSNEESGSGFNQLKVSPNPSEKGFLFENIENAESLSIINSLGQIVYNSELNDQQFYWSGRSRYGSILPSGIYSAIFYGKKIELIKLIIN